jgi:hypothetical protein
MSGFWKTILVDIILETIKKLLRRKKHGMESTGKETTQPKGGTETQDPEKVT